MKNTIQFLKNVRCFWTGHTQTNVCQKCGKLVNLAGKPASTLEQRINEWWNAINRKKKPIFEGSLMLKPGMIKYELDLKTNVLSRLHYDEERLSTGKVISRNAHYKPTCMYFDAMNDNVAVRKANKMLFGIKKGIRIEKVSYEEKNGLTLNTTQS